MIVFQAELCNWGWTLVLGNTDAVDWKGNPCQVHGHFPQGAAQSFLSSYVIQVLFYFCHKSPSSQACECLEQKQHTAMST